MTNDDLYPLSLKLFGRQTVVVGGGTVAARRTQSLLDAGARVRVVSPELGSAMSILKARGLVDWTSRGYVSGDLSDAWLVHAAVGKAHIDDQVAADAESLRVWCVKASDAESSSAWMPAVARVKGFTLAVNANGDPRRAASLRDAIRGQIDLGRFPIKHHRVHGGCVALVGGGPGADDLITARGLELLVQADVVVTDRLAPRGLLSRIGPGTEVIDVGKSPQHHQVPQHEINSILVRKAQAGARVVRLKGGDPYVLGRGGEEAAFCRAHGVELEIVPGVTSAIAVPGIAGIPVTHRGLAKGFTVVSGHEQFADLPQGSNHTLVLLMGIAGLRQTAAALKTSQRGPHCPVAIVEDGFGSNQRVTIGTLETIADQADALMVKAPAVVVVGDVVSLSPLAPNYFDESTLQGDKTCFS